MARNKKSNKISDHFSKKDFECKCGNCNYSIRISLGLIGGLELLRALSQRRVNIQKGFQCSKSAESQGKLRRNFYAMGLAADIVVSDKTLEEVFLLAEKISEFTTIGLNLDEKCIHVNTRKESVRKLWVQKNNQEIELNETNRTEYSL